MKDNLNNIDFLIIFCIQLIDIFMYGYMCIIFFPEHLFFVYSVLMYCYIFGAAQCDYIYDCMVGIVCVCDISYILHDLS